MYLFFCHNSEQRFCQSNSLDLIKFSYKPGSGCWPEHTSSHTVCIYKTQRITLNNINHVILPIIVHFKARNFSWLVPKSYPSLSMKVVVLRWQYFGLDWLLPVSLGSSCSFGFETDAVSWPLITVLRSTQMVFLHVHCASPRHESLPGVLLLTLHGLPFTHPVATYQLALPKWSPGFVLGDGFWHLSKICIYKKEIQFYAQTLDRALMVTKKMCWKTNV